MGKIVGGIPNKILGTKMFEYRIYGDIPPGVDPELIKPTIMSSISITATLLPFMKHQMVIVHDTMPDELTRALSGLKVPPA